MVDDDPALLDGIRAYAHKQASLQTRMAGRCASHWLPVLEQHGITPCWKADFVDEVGMFVIEGHATRQGQQLGQDEQHDDDDIAAGDSENESELDDEEDIIDSFTFED